MEAWFADLCQEWERRYGRGWKRRLAELVGVSDSNVQSWIKAGRVPPAVRSAIENSERALKAERELKEQEADDECIIAMCANGEFMILTLEENGIHVCRGRFRDREDAIRCRAALSGELERRIADVLDRVEDLCENHPDDLAALRRLENWAAPPRRVQIASLTRDLKSMGIHNHEK